MRPFVIATALLSLAAGSVPVWAQTMAPATMAPASMAPASMAPASPPVSPTGARPGNVIGTDNSLPTGTTASNITPSDTRSTIAPRLPDPGVGDGASPRDFLTAARQSLAAGQTGRAQEALERAESRALDRSTAPSQANRPSGQDLVKMISDAREALGSGDKARSLSLIDQALAGAG